MPERFEIYIVYKMALYKYSSFLFYRQYGRRQRGTWRLYVRFPVDSMRLATLTVSPKRQYLGIVTPTTPPTTDPLCRPQRIINWRSGRCAIYAYIIQQPQMMLTRVAIEPFRRATATVTALAVVV